MASDRVFFHFQSLEEWHAGMWRPVRGEERTKNARAAADLMRRPEDFKAAMLRALTEWPNSCIHNLSADAVNKLAWLGHAGNCIAHGSPEENTRVGWHMLNQAEQDEANRVAAEVLEVWETERERTQRSLF